MPLGCGPRQNLLEVTLRQNPMLPLKSSGPHWQAVGLSLRLSHAVQVTRTVTIDALIDRPGPGPLSHSRCRPPESGVASAWSGQVRYYPQPPHILLLVVTSSSRIADASGETDNRRPGPAVLGRGGHTAHRPTGGCVGVCVPCSSWQTAARNHPYLSSSH